MNELEKKELEEKRVNIINNEMKRIIVETYELYGFLPQETPIIEASEVLLAKAGYEISDITDFESLKNVVEDITSMRIIFQK